MHGYRKCLLLLLQFVFSYAGAQQPYSLVHYDENTLPQTTIGNIQQDAYGYLWMNSQFGIVRFDGEAVRVFTTANLKGLTSNRIRTCAKGLDKSIYFINEDHSIIKVVSPNNFEIIPAADVHKKLKLPLSSSASNNDFAYLQIDKTFNFERFIRFLNMDTDREMLKAYATGPDKGCFFYADRQDNTRLCYYEGTAYDLKVMPYTFQAKHTFKLNQLVFSQTRSGEAWLFEKAELKQKIPVRGLPTVFDRAFGGDDPVLFSNEAGTFFYGSGKLYQYHLTDTAIVATLIFENLPCTGVVNVMQERTTGDVMISTRSTGFYRIKKKQFSVINLTGAPVENGNAGSNINNNIVYGLTLWDRQRIFCSGYITPVSGNGGSRRFDPQNKGRFNHFFLYPKDSTHVWLNFNDGIQSFNKKTGSYTPLLKIFEPKKALDLSNGTTVIVAKSSIVALQNNQVTELFQSDTLEFTTAEKVTENCLSVGTTKGIFYFYPAQRKLQAIRYNEELKVRAIYKDKAARLWFTTYGQGLFHLSNNSIKSLPVDNAGYLAIGHSIIEDNRGHFWVPTNHGLFRLAYTSLLSIIRGQSSKLYYTYFDKTDGFNTNEFNGGCAPANIYQKETGLVFFPSMDGVVKFNPDSVQSVNSASPLFFDEIVRNDTGHIYAVAGQAVFPSETASLRLFFSSPYYGHGQNVRFSYMLSNAPHQWKELQGVRHVDLANLPGGSYTLTLKKEEAAGASILTHFNFKIEKNFSETTPFKLLLLSLVLAMVYLFFRARLLYLNNERKRLEKEVAARTAEQLKLISHKENIIAVLIHDIKSPLYFLNTVATHLNKNIDQNPLVKNKQIAGEIAISLNRLYLFTQDFATWLNASRPGHIQKGERVDLKEAIEEALTVYKEIIDKKGISIHQEIALKTIYGDEPMIKSIIRNLIDNAVKNTPAGSITITTACPQDTTTCEISIADEGKGMSEEQIAALNHYFRSGDSTTVFSTSGFGHKIIKDFLDKLGGAIRYRKNSARGIVVTVHLPAIHLLQQKALTDSQHSN